MTYEDEELVTAVRDALRHPLDTDAVRTAHDALGELAGRLRKLQAHAAWAVTRYDDYREAYDLGDQLEARFQLKSAMNVLRRALPPGAPTPPPAAEKPQGTRGDQ